MWRRLKELVFGQPSYTAHALQESVLPLEETWGVLLRVQPYHEGGGIPAAVAFFRAMHEVTTTRFRTRNTSPTYAFEIWFDAGRLSFYLYAPSETTADRIRRRIQATYPNSRIERVTRGVAFPRIEDGEYVTGATVRTRDSAYYPIRHPANQGFETDPYQELLQEAVATPESRVVLQVVFRPAKQSWTRGSWFRRNSLEDTAHGLRQGTSVGWLHPRTRPASSVDLEAARVIEAQRNQPGFHTTIRILAVSPSKREAGTRVRRLGSLVRSHYTGIRSQALTARPVWHHRETKHRTRLYTHIERMQQRSLTPAKMILTNQELAGVAHLPGETVEIPEIAWQRTRQGNPIGVDVPTVEETLADHTPEDTHV